MSGIGKAITDKLTEFINTGQVKNLEKLKSEYNTEDYENEKIKQAKKDIFLQIHGIGDAAAEKLIDLGITTIEELKARKNEEIPGKGTKKLKLLNATQQKGLEYYEEILEKSQERKLKNTKPQLRSYSMKRLIITPRTISLKSLVVIDEGNKNREILI